MGWVSASRIRESNGTANGGVGAGAAVNRGQFRLTGREEPAQVSGSAESNPESRDGRGAGF